MTENFDAAEGTGDCGILLTTPSDFTVEEKANHAKKEEYEIIRIVETNKYEPNKREIPIGNHNHIDHVGTRVSAGFKEKTRGHGLRDYEYFELH